MERQRIAGLPVEPALRIPGVGVPARIIVDDRWRARRAERGAIFLGPFQVAPVIAATQGETERGAQRQLIFQRDGIGGLALGLLGLRGRNAGRRKAGLELDMLIVAVMEGEAQRVRVGCGEIQLGRSAPRLVFIGAVKGVGPALRGQRPVVEGAEHRIELVIIGAGLERGPVAQRRVRQEIDAGDVPGRPVPETGRGDRVADMQRRALRSFLMGIAQRIFVGGIGSEADLGIDPPVFRP